MTSRAALTVISHGASLTNGLMRSVNSIKKKKKKEREGTRLLAEMWSCDAANGIKKDAK